ncbi:hypothetical protein KY325_04990, partial [Candidatus Woesearchaeota archaeon]|nr:hypothetical protein [Candidatus Woesearchaeota archaeon]
MAPLESLVGGVRSLLGGAIGKFAGSVVLGAGLLFGAAGISGCIEGEEHIETEAVNETNEFNAIPGHYKVSLFWDLPEESDISEIMIRRKQDTFPINETDGILIYQGSENSYEDQSIDVGVLYCYKMFFISSTDPIIYSGLSASATPIDAIPPDGVTNLSGSLEEGWKVRVSWTRPTNSDLAGIKVMRKMDGFPTGPDDGAQIYLGPSIYCIDAALSD